MHLLEKDTNKTFTILNLCTPVLKSITSEDVLPELGLMDPGLTPGGAAWSEG